MIILILRPLFLQHLMSDDVNFLPTTHNEVSDRGKLMGRGVSVGRRGPDTKLSTLCLPYWARLE